MTKADKLLTRMRANPRDWRLEDLLAVARRLNIHLEHEGSNHVVFRHPTGEHVSVPAAMPIKPVYIKKFLALAGKITGE